MLVDGPYKALAHEVYALMQLELDALHWCTGLVVNLQGSSSSSAAVQTQCFLLQKKPRRVYGAYEALSHDVYALVLPQLSLPQLLLLLRKRVETV